MKIISTHLCGDSISEFAGQKIVTRPPFARDGGNDTRERKIYTEVKCQVKDKGTRGKHCSRGVEVTKAGKWN